MGYINRPVTSIYARRTFSDKFTATTDFLSANWRSLLRYIAMFMVPICLIQTFCMDHYMTLSVSAKVGVSASDTISLMLYYLLLLLFSTLGGFLMFSIVYAILRIHHHMTGDVPPAHLQDDAYLQDKAPRRSISFEQLRPLLKAQARPLLKAIATGFIYLIVLAIGFTVLVALSSMAGTGVAVTVACLLLVAALLCTIAIFSMIIPVFEFENPDIITGFRRAARYGLHTLGGILAQAIVFCIIVSVIGGLLAVPYFICFFMKTMFTLGEEEQFAFTSAPWFLFVQYILGVIYLLANYLLSSTLIVAMAYQYGHAKEKLDGASDEELTSF